MYPPVDGQGGPLTESLEADLALEGFLPSVNANVHLEVLRVREGFGAKVASVRAFAGMDSPVLLEVFRAAQTLAAKVT